MALKKFFGIMIISLLIPLFWDQVPAIKDGIHALLDPSVGALLNWNTNLGFVIIVFIFSLITLLLQKFTVDNVEVKRLKDQQKALQKQTRDHKDNPQKMMELNKQSMELAMQIMNHSLRPAIYTMIPFILFFRWFVDYFAANPGGIFGMNWVVAYLIISIILSIFLRRLLKLP